MEIHLQSFGAKLRVRGGIFVVAIPDVSGGGKDSEYEYAPHQVSSILMYGKSGSISVEAILLALKHEVDIMVCDQHGNVVGHFDGDPADQRVITQVAQMRLVGTPRGLEFAKQWVTQKFRRKIAFLERLERYREGEKAALLKTARQKLAEHLARLHYAAVTPVAKAAENIRTIEANGSLVYLNTLSDLLPAEYQFDHRSRQPATDMFNAFLNYGYGVLYRQVEKALRQAGLNVHAGFLHSILRNQKAFLFDVTDAYRPWVDHIVFSLFGRKLPNRQHLDVREGGGYWLSAAGKALLLESYYEAFDKTQPVEVADSTTMRRVLREEVQATALAIRKTWKEFMPDGEMAERA